MYNDISKESYDSLFTVTYEKPVNKCESYSRESTLNKKIEQNHIITRDDIAFSLEDDSDEDDSSFEEAAGGEDESSFDDAAGGDDFSDDSGGDSDFGDDSGFGDDGGDFGEGGDDSSSDDSSGDNNGIDTIDNNKGSSLNPFTQINQKMYHIDRLNELLNSINHSIDLYNVNYADWSEVEQLKELKSIVAEEQKSFIMQQNPENLIKLGLFYEQYDRIVQNISNKIVKINSNDKN